MKLARTLALLLPLVVLLTAWTDQPDYVVADSAVGNGSSPDTDTTGTFPFRRLNDPVMVAIGPTAQMTPVPASAWQNPNNGQNLTTFHVVNPNKVWVRLKGWGNATDCANPSNQVTPTTAWLWPPGFVGVYSTQLPMCVSAMAVVKPGYPLPAGSTWPDGTPAYAPLELSYGTGQ